MSEEREFKSEWRDFNHGTWSELDKEFDHVAWEKCFKTCTGENSKTIDDWADQLTKELKEAMAVCGGNPPFRPSAYYNAEGDILEVYLSKEMYYARWLNPQVTVLLSQESDEVVGFQIWGLSGVKRIEELQNAIQERKEYKEKKHGQKK